MAIGIGIPALLPVRARNSSALCNAECRTLYSAISVCESTSQADYFSSDYCGRVNNSYCSDLRLKDNDLVTAVFTNCGRDSYCSSSCNSSIARLESFSGCCRASYLNNSCKYQDTQPEANYSNRSLH